jgi:hypothetical protein
MIDAKVGALVMIKLRIAALGLSAAALGAASPAAAQAAAEHAVVTSGTSGQGAAAREMGDAVRGSVRSATARITASPRSQARRSTRRPSGHRGSRSAPASVRDTGDALANTNAATYQTQSGARIRLSGGFTPSASTTCTAQCGKTASEKAKADQPAQTEKPD